MWAATTALRQPVLQLAHRHARTTYTKPFVTSADLELDPNSLLAWPTTVNVSGFEVKIPQGIPFDKALYTFKDKKLEKQIYTHKSCGIKEAAWGAGSEVVRLDNEHLEWLGDSVLKGLTAHLIDNLYPDLNEGDTSALQSALVSNRFYCHLTRTLGIAGRLEIGGSASIQTIGTERVIGGLFEAYIGGIHRETGLGGYPTLYRWFEDLVKPYAIQFPRIIASVQPLHFKGFQGKIVNRIYKIRC